MKESTNGPLKNYQLLSNGKKRDRCIKIEEGKKMGIHDCNDSIKSHSTKDKKKNGKDRRDGEGLGVRKLKVEKGGRRQRKGHKGQIKMREGKRSYSTSRKEITEA